MFSSTEPTYNIFASNPKFCLIIMLSLLFLFFVILVVLCLFVGKSTLGISTDVNSGDVDDTFAIAYVITEGFFVRGSLTYIRAMLRWYVPFVQSCTVKVILHSNGNLLYFLNQLKSQIFGPVTQVYDGFLTVNYELIEIYQGNYKAIFPPGSKSHYVLVSVDDSLKVELLEIAGPTSCMVDTTHHYVGKIDMSSSSETLIEGENAKELSSNCVKRALGNGATVQGLSPDISRQILCCIDSRSPLLATAAQLQLNPWAFSFVQSGPNAVQFARCNEENGERLLTTMGLTYERIWSKLDNDVREEVLDFVSKFSHWDDVGLVYTRVLWAVLNFGGKFPWRSHTCTSVNPPFDNLCSILKTDKEMNPEELFKFRVFNISQFMGLQEKFVLEVLAQVVLYDLYATVLFKYNLRAEHVVNIRRRSVWFRNHVQKFVDKYTDHNS